MIWVRFFERLVAAVDPPEAKIALLYVGVCLIIAIIDRPQKKKLDVE